MMQNEKLSKKLISKCRGILKNDYFIDTSKYIVHCEITDELTAFIIFNSKENKQNSIQINCFYSDIENLHYSLSF